MPKNRKEEIIYTTIGVLLMATVMTAFNKFRVMGTFSAEFFTETLKGALLRYPVVWPLQYFIVQPCAGKRAAAAQPASRTGYQLERIKYTVLLTCPVMSLYSNLILAVKYHWGFAQLVNSFIPGMCVNAVFAFFIQFFLFNKLNEVIFRLVCHKNREIKEEQP